MLIMGWLSCERSGGPIKQNRHPSHFVPGRQAKHTAVMNITLILSERLLRRPVTSLAWGFSQHNRHPYRLIIPVIFIIIHLVQCDAAQSSVASMTPVTFLFLPPPPSFPQYKSRSVTTSTKTQTNNSWILTSGVSLS